MPSLTIRKIEPEMKENLRVRAAKHGRSMESEVRAILKEALQGKDFEGESFGSLIRRHVEPVGGIELDLPPRENARDLPNFE